MGMFYTQQGMVAVVVDNPGIGETSDLDQYANYRSYDRQTFSQYLNDMGWSYLGLSSFQGQQILDWMKTRDFINPAMIALSGHSLGTEQVMVLAVLNPDIAAVVFNDFLCNQINRLVAITKPDSLGKRPSFFSYQHHFKNELEWFDYPDLVASLAPRPLILSEGGAAADLDYVRRAYQIMDADSNIAIYHYPKYRDPRARKHDYEEIPEGLDLYEYFEYVNVDAENHYFKADIVVPWLTRVLQSESCR
jgi:pimeloyl-ACP methyl ester carboxylesterase